MYENRSQQFLTRRLFLRRVLLHGLAALGIIAVSLAIGTLGYHGWGEKSWIDSFLNASMLLGGMGPVGDLSTNSGKLFASLYALYAGIVLLAVVSILLAPVLHRVLHKLHLEMDGKASKG